MNFVLPPKTSIKYGGSNFFNTMPSLMPFTNVFGVKEVSRINGRHPAVQADILLYDTISGEKIAFIDGTWITTMRTGAVAAISIEKLQKTNSFVYAFVGLGQTARANLTCLNEILHGQDLQIKILVYKDQHKKFIKDFEQYKNLKFHVISNIDELMKNSDVVVSCVTCQKENFSDVSNYKEGVLLVPVHSMGFQNCDLVFDKIFCDDISHVSGFKYFNKFKSITEMTDILNMEKYGRENEKQRLIAYNIGISAQDIFFAHKILGRVSESDNFIKYIGEGV